MFLSFLPCPELNFHSKHPFATHKTCPSLVLPVVSVAHLQHIRHGLFTHTLNERWDCSRMLANSDSWFESVLLQLWELWDWLWHHQVQQVLVHAHRTKFPWAHRTHRTYWTVDSGELPQPCMISTTKTIMTNWCVTRTAGSSTFSYVEDWKLEKQQTASHDSHWDISEPYILQTDHPKSQTRQSPHPSESKQQQKDCEWSIPVKKFQVPNGSGVAHSHSKSILADISTKKTLTKCVKSTIDQGALQRTKTLLMIERSNYFSRDLEQQLAFMIFIPLSLWFISAACQPELCLGSQKNKQLSHPIPAACNFQ